jgi:hypothetical protein
MTQELPTRTRASSAKGGSISWHCRLAAEGSLDAIEIDKSTPVADLMVVQTDQLAELWGGVLAGIPNADLSPCDAIVV